MTNSPFTFSAIATALLLSACGGASTSGSSLESYAAELSVLRSDPTLSSNTPDMTVNALNGTATYNGIINIGTDVASNPAGSAAYYGRLSMNVDFSSGRTDDIVTGNAGNFVQFFSAIASPKTGESVSGNITLSGNLTGTNTAGIANGINGTAAGLIDGIDVAYTFDGSITGLAGNGMSLFFDGRNANSTGGVGFAVE